MPPARVAAWLESYRQDFKSALQSAARDGFALLQPNAALADFDPRAFGHSARRHLRRYLGGLGIELDAVGVEFGGLGLADAALADARVDRLRGALELCADLDVRTATASIAGFADESTRDMANEVLAAVAELSDRYGIRIAIQSGCDDPALVARRVREIACPTLGVALDTATFHPGSDAAAVFANLVEVVHVRDVRKRGSVIEEVAFGEGETDFGAWLDMLEQAAYEGSLAVRRDAGGGGVDAMRQGREYIATQLSRFRAR